MDKTSRVPLYLQLMETIINEISENKYLVDEKLPSERELCDLYDVSRITVRQALQELEREGYIYKLHGKGTFVSPTSFNQKLVKLYSFTEEMKKLGKNPTTQVISFEKMKADERLASRMSLDEQKDVYQIIRIRLADDDPLIYETSYVPTDLFPGLTKNELEKRPMYDIFKEDYGIVVDRAIERFSATVIRKKEAEHLDTFFNQPAMLVKRFAYNKDNLIEYTISVTRGDKFEYTVELT